jgi:hypothetical protein
LHWQYGGATNKQSATTIFKLDSGKIALLLTCRLRQGCIVLAAALFINYICWGVTASEYTFTFCSLLCDYYLKNEKILVWAGNACWTLAVIVQVVSLARLT